MKVVTNTQMICPCCFFGSPKSLKEIPINLISKLETKLINQATKYF